MKCWSKMRGGTEAYLAWSERPLPRGTQILVYNTRGDRALDVMEFTTGAEGASVHAWRRDL